MNFEIIYFWKFCLKNLIEKRGKKEFKGNVVGSVLYNFRYWFVNNKYNN